MISRFVSAPAIGTRSLLSRGALLPLCTLFFGARPQGVPSAELQQRLWKYEASQRVVEVFAQEVSTELSLPSGTGRTTSTQDTALTMVYVRTISATDEGVRILAERAQAADLIDARGIKAPQVTDAANVLGLDVISVTCKSHSVVSAIGASISGPQTLLAARDCEVPSLPRRLAAVIGRIPDTEPVTVDIPGSADVLPAPLKDLRLTTMTWKRVTSTPDHANAVSVELVGSSTTVVGTTGKCTGTTEYSGTIAVDSIAGDLVMRLQLKGNGQSTLPSGLQAVASSRGTMVYGLHLTAVP
jgi:hypothetical protein